MSGTTKDQHALSPNPSLHPYLPEWLDDPYPLYQRLRGMGDMVLINDDLWAATTMRAVRAISLDVDRFRCESPALSKKGSDGSVFAVTRELLLRLDGAKHRASRQVVGAPLTPARLKAMEPLMSEKVTEVLDRFSEGGRCDFYREIAFEFTSSFMLDRLAVSEEIKPDLLEWGAAFFDVAGRRVDPELFGRANDAVDNFMAYITPLLEERRQCPGDDFISHLVRASDDGVFDTKLQLCAHVFNLFLGGYDTTSSTLCNLMQAFFDHPEQWELLKERPDLASAAIEEICRWDMVPQHLTRIAAEDIEFYGADLKEGQEIILLLGSANRDESVFEDADRFLIDRDRTHHVGFGVGPHFCLGAALARMEMNAALPEIVRRFPNIKPAGKPVQHRPGFTRGWRSLPVEL